MNPNLDRAQREALQRLIESLERKDPEDPSPATTRELVRLLRVCRDDGPEGMMHAVVCQIDAAIGALQSLGAKPSVAAKTILTIVVARTQEWVGLDGIVKASDDARAQLDELMKGSHK